MVAKAQRDVRKVFAQPPYGAWVLVSGAGADEYVEKAKSISEAEGADVAFRHQQDRWRLSAPDHDELLNVVNATERPADRIRIEVDPLDI